jgi:hypothetical protein
MAADRRRRDRELAMDLARRPRRLGNELNDPPPGRVGENRQQLARCGRFLTGCDTYH